MEEKKFDLRRLQLEELEILKEVDRICRKYSLKYFLAYGTAIGAIRHKGFIPWDDDIDIHMPINDYIKFKEICKKELNKKYFYQDFETDKYFMLSWTKIRNNNTASIERKLKKYPMNWGICIDIFPIIPLKNIKKTKKLRLEIKILKKLCNKRLNDFEVENKIKNNTSSKIYSKMPTKIVDLLRNKIYNHLISKNKDKKTNYCYTYCNNIQLYDASMFEDSIEVDFENQKFFIMAEYDKYLTYIFGDYMKIPDVKNQINHGDIIVDFDKSYKEYMIS